MIVLDASFESSAPDLAGAPPPDLPEVCFAGRSNVGKSSALNALTGRRRLAHVSKTPGRTRLLTFYRVELADRPGPTRRTAKVRLCDLPGYGFAMAPKGERRRWGTMIEGYLAKRESLRCIVMLVDAQVGAQPLDFEMMEFLAASPVARLVVATKADRLARTRVGSSLDRVARDLGVARANVVAFSAEEPIGRQELWNGICTAAGVLGRRSMQVLEGAPRE